MAQRIVPSPLYLDLLARLADSLPNRGGGGSGGGFDAVDTDVGHGNSFAVYLIKRIRELDPDARIIAASGLGAQAAAGVPGVMHFLPKPLTADAVLKAVSDAIRR